MLDGGGLASGRVELRNEMLDQFHTIGIRFLFRSSYSISIILEDINHKSTYSTYEQAP